MNQPVHEMFIIAKNTNGLVARIMSLFNKRGFFVRKMTAGATNNKGEVRLTLVVEGDEDALSQIQKQIYKIVDVIMVRVFPEEGVIKRELMLVKVKSSKDTMTQITEITSIYRGKILDIGPESIVVELTGDTGKLRGFLDMMDTFGILEVAKSGDLAMNRGETM